LFLDRDQAGQSGCRQAEDQIAPHGLDVEVFDWDRFVPQDSKRLVQDPADMSVEQLRTLRRKGIL